MANQMEFELRVLRNHISNMPKVASSCVILIKNNRGAVIDFETIDFGKTVFLTREEAEAKLAEMEGENE